MAKNKNNKKLYTLLSTGLTALNLASPALAATVNIATETELRATATFQENDVLNITEDITLTNNLPQITKTISIDGNNKTLNFNNKAGWKFTKINSLSNLNITNVRGAVPVISTTYVNDGIYNVHINNVNLSTITNIYGGGIASTGSLATPITVDGSSFNNINIHGDFGARGSGLYIFNSGRKTITNNSFTNNTATSNTTTSLGGAIYVNRFIDNSVLENNIFTNNTAHTGGAIFMLGTLSQSLIKGNTFTSNKASGFDGGALYAETTSNVTFADNIFTNNYAQGNGGAIRIGSLTNTIFENNRFSGNHAEANGGALFFSNGGYFKLNDTTFQNNTANLLGGAIFSNAGMELTVDAGKTTTFLNNTDSSGANSMYFKGTLADFKVNGELYLYDPIKAPNNINRNFQKLGSGLMVLGGASELLNSKWNIKEGTFRLTYDSQNNAAQITNAKEFNTISGATLEIVPDISLGNQNPAQISANQISLNGNTAVGSDYRYIDRLNISGDQILLTLNSNNITQNDTITNVEGSFTLGQYDYEYENLHWDGNNLLFNIKALKVSSERNGAYAANADFRTHLTNKTPHLIFEHFQKPFAYMKANQHQQNLTSSKKLHENLWGSAFYSKTNYAEHNNESGANADISGLILGQDFNVTDSSFNGIAVSVAWPKYEQGSLEATGKDIRLNFYGGKLLKGNWEFGYTSTVGFGDIAHDRKVGNINNSAKKDVKTYSVGFNLAKDFYQDQDTTLRPFFSYEYIKNHSDGYTESDPLVGITSSGHREDTSRIRLGLNYIKHSKNNSSFVGTVFYQGLYGDRNSNISSYMTSNPNSLINLSGSSVDKHALGLGLGWNKRFNEKLNLNLSYNALFSANANDHQIKAELNFKF